MSRQADSDQVERFRIEFEQYSLACYRVNGREDAKSSAILLHGAGVANKERTLALGIEMAVGVGEVLALDFVGHGESSGKLQQSSLEHRFLQAKHLIDTQVDASADLILVGFSISGQTVGDLIRHFGERVAAIGLCAPAIYTQHAWTVRFDSGFTELIREEGSWMESGALNCFRSFTGRSVLAAPESDDIIPAGVTSLIAQALNGSDLTRLVFRRAGHQLGVHFRDDRADRLEFTRTLLAGF
jgi:pimeloyl-ACP methyl ester carboxylesterase